MSKKNLPTLQRLAEFAGVLTGYHDIFGNWIEAQPEILMAVLRALEYPVKVPEQAEGILAQKKLAHYSQPLDPVIAHRGKGQPVLELRQIKGTGPNFWEYDLLLESGNGHSGRIDLDNLSEGVTVQDDGITYHRGLWRLPHLLEPGYHQLHLKTERESYSCLLIIYPPASDLPNPSRSWGIFCPLYSLKSNHTWGIGDFGTLKNLSQWVGEIGGSFISTLPLLPLCNRSTESPSPYSAQSRFFWEEIYLDPEILNEFSHCSTAQQLLSSSDLQCKIENLQKSSRVDYPEVRKLKRRLWEEIIPCLQQNGETLWQEFKNFVEQFPLLQAYGRFRGEQENNFSEGERYHQFVQWLCFRQMKNLITRFSGQDVRLALDYPLGVHPEGFDHHYFKDNFAEGISTGAPPDFFFQEGQNWGFAPPHPRRRREAGYDYLRRSLRHHLHFGKLLRIDHIMAAHRLFWIPDGCSAKEGVYVQYPAEEFYAILNLEAFRNQAVIVGEDLGTVPPDVRPAMKRHGILRSFVYQFEEHQNLNASEGQIPPESVASLNTHDMPPFAKYWENRPQPEEALNRALHQLAGSSAAVVLINLEDLWLETEPQNVPGITSRSHNWQRKLRYSLEEIQKSPSLKKMLKRIDQIRHNKENSGNDR